MEILKINLSRKISGSKIVVFLFPNCRIQHELLSGAAASATEPEGVGQDPWSSSAELHACGRATTFPDELRSAADLRGRTAGHHDDHTLLVPLKHAPLVADAPGPATWGGRGGRACAKGGEIRQSKPNRTHSFKRWLLTDSYWGLHTRNEDGKRLI